MARYATGKKAVAISDRSGFKIKHRDLKTTWDGLRVEKEEWEPKHPQLTPAKNVFDATALFKPRPDNDPENVNIFIGFNYDPFLDIRNRPSIGTSGLGSVGQAEINSSEAPAVTGVAGTGAVGTATALNITEVSATGVATSGAIGVVPFPPPLAGVSSIGAVGLTNDVATDVVVTVQSVDGANKYFIGGSQQAVVNMIEGNIYRFDQSDSSNSGHPLRFSTTSNGTHAGGSTYSTGVTVVGTPGTDGAYTQIIPEVGAPTLYYFCTQHSGMGGTANTLTNVSVVATLLANETGVAGTGAAGTFSPTAVKGVAGLSGTGSVGVEALSLSIDEAGVSGTGAVGTESISAGVTLSATGAAGTAAVGNETLAVGPVLSVTGVAGTGAVGTESISAGVSLSATGAAGTGAVGTEALELSINEAGVAGTGAVGTESATGGATLSATGAAGAGAVGAEALELSINEAGVAGTGAVGAESVNVGGWGNEAWGDSTWGDG
jgi:hypothetical protein